MKHIRKALNSFLKRKTDEDTLADILAIKYAGNLADDTAKLDRVHAFLCRDDVPVGDKFVADYVSSLHSRGLRMQYSDVGDVLNTSTEEVYKNYAEYFPGKPTYMGYTE